jgi:hypothetical protein
MQIFIQGFSDFQSRSWMVEKCARLSDAATFSHDPYDESVIMSGESRNGIMNDKQSQPP